MIARAARLPFALVALAVAAAPLAAEEHPNHAQGFQAERLYQLGELDSVALFNGNLTLRIPLGGSYPVGGGFSYGLTLTYTGNVWEYETAQGPSGFDYVIAWPRKSSNAGLGWKLTFGEIAEEGGYRTSDGSVHPFSPKLHATSPTQTDTEFSTDGTYLRSRAGEVEFPDGTRHILVNGKLDTIVDRFGNSLRIEYIPANIPEYPAIRHWKLTDSHGRMHWVKFKKPPALGGRYAEGVVDRIELAAFNGGTATYVFHYPDPAIDSVATTITRGFTDPGVGCNIGSTTIQVPLLERITQPDGSEYQFTYDLGPYHQTCTSGGANLINTDSLSGHLTKMTLPTKGSIQWGWNYYVFPQESGQPVPMHVQPQGTTTFLKAYTRSMGVVSRKMLDADGTPYADLPGWTYQQGLDTSQQPVREGTTTVTDPLGHKTVHYFSVYSCKPDIQPDCPMQNPEPSGWSYQDYGLPFTRNTTDATGTRFLSSEIRQGASTVKRRTYLRYENSGYNYTAGTHINHRVASSRTVYLDDANRFADVTYTSFDGHGNYRTATTDGNFPAGNVQTTHTEFNPGRSMSSILGAGVPWVLGTFTNQTVTVGTATVRTDACFEPNGFLKRRRTRRVAGSTGAGDLVTELEPNTSGNVKTVRSYGGDTQSLPGGALCTLALPAPTYQISHTYEKGSLQSSQYLGQTFKSADFDIDPSTGLVLTSRDVSGVSTSYVYDAMGRLTNVRPAEEGWTNYIYSKASGTATPAKVFISRRTNGGGTELAAEDVHFDALGRVAVERRKLADGTFSSRTTTYYPQGWLKSRSEWGAVHATTYLNPDPFGRPATIRPPDGAAHDVTLTYKGVQEVKRTVKVGTAWTGTAVTETPATTTELYDRQGRLWRVKELANPDGSESLATYLYDVGGRLAQVNQTGKNLAGTAVTQSRRFTYDNRGFLVSEQHPEKGAAGNGTVTYSAYDARGHAGQVVDGSNTLRFTYDGAERLTAVEESVGFGLWRPLRSFTYADSNLGFNRRLGKLWVARAYNYPVIGTTAYTAEITETYGYAGKQGRVSVRDTVTQLTAPSTGVLGSFTQDWTWNDLGDPASITYPRCTNAGCAATTMRTMTPGYTNGFLTSVPGYASSITYHPNGQVNQVFRANDTTDIYTKDPQNQARPRKIETRVTSSGTLRWQSGLLSYDGAGNLTRTGSAYYLYDPVSRVTEGLLYLAPGGSASGASASFDHAYDGFGNLQSLTTNATTRNTPTSATTNRLTGAATYDAAGNLVSWGGASYQYDALNQMWGMTNGAEDWFYLYTADGERILSFKPSTDFSRWIVRDLDGKVLREFHGQGGVWRVERDYVYRGSQLLATHTADPAPNDLIHLHPDHLGTPRAITNQNAVRTDYHVYFPFGEEASSPTQDVERMKFTGHERDLGDPSSPADDLDYMHARFSNPQTGRFLSVDPILGNARQPQSWNRYTYALGNPLKYRDPSGRYVVNCSPGDDTQCKEDAAAFEEARQENLKSNDEAVRNAALAYGDPGEDNGVTVAFGETGKRPGSTTVNMEANTDGTSASLVATVTVSSGLRGLGLTNAVAHEGQHLVDAQAFAATFVVLSSEPWARYDASLNLTEFQTESNAYRITHSIYKDANERYSTGCRGCVLGKGLRTDAEVELAIKKILADPRNYGVTPTNQGNRQFNYQ